MEFLIIIIYLAVIVVVIAGFWKVFSKAGKPGWAAIIPIYNLVVMVEISKKPMWWVVLFFIPLINYIAMFVINIEIAKKFGKGAGFGVGMTLLAPIFWPMLGFGDAQYEDAADMSDPDILDS